MPSFEVDFEVRCNCGEGLCNQSDTGATPGRGMPYVTVEPCPKCVDVAKQEGYEEGYDAALAELEE